MLCYRDRTYCSYWKACMKGKECTRALTDEVNISAEKAGMPIAQFGEKPKCFERDNANA